MHEKSITTSIDVGKRAKERDALFIGNIKTLTAIDDALQDKRNQAAVRKAHTFSDVFTTFAELVSQMPRIEKKLLYSHTRAEATPLNMMILFGAQMGIAKTGEQVISGYPGLPFPQDYKKDLDPILFTDAGWVTTGINGISIWDVYKEKHLNPVKLLNSLVESWDIHDEETTSAQPVRTTNKGQEQPAQNQDVYPGITLSNKLIAAHWFKALVLRKYPSLEELKKCSDTEKLFLFNYFTAMTKFKAHQDSLQHIFISPNHKEYQTFMNTIESVWDKGDFYQKQGLLVILGLINQKNLLTHLRAIQELSLQDGKYREIYDGFARWMEDEITMWEDRPDGVDELYDWIIHERNSEDPKEYLNRFSAAIHVIKFLADQRHLSVNWDELQDSLKGSEKFLRALRKNGHRIGIKDDQKDLLDNWLPFVTPSMVVVQIDPNHPHSKCTLEFHWKDSKTRESFQAKIEFNTVKKEMEWSFFDHPKQDVNKPLFLLFSYYATKLLKAAWADLEKDQLRLQLTKQPDTITQHPSNRKFSRTLTPPITISPQPEADNKKTDPLFEITAESQPRRIPKFPIEWTEDVDADFHMQDTRATLKEVAKTRIKTYLKTGKGLRPITPPSDVPMARWALKFGDWRILLKPVEKDNQTILVPCAIQPSGHT